MKDPREVLKQRGLKRVVKQLSNSEQIEEVCNVLAELERAHVDAVIDLQEAANVDGLEEPPDPERRSEVLQELIRNMVSGEFENWWLEEIAAESIDVEEVDPGRYVAIGADSEEWQTTIETWADRWREYGEDLENVDDRDLADRHVRSTWDVSLEEFETELVDMHPAREAERVFRAHFRAAREGVENVTRELEGSG